MDRAKQGVTEKTIIITLNTKYNAWRNDLEKNEKAKYRTSTIK